VPYDFVVVELDGGSILHSDGIGCPNEAIHISMAVEVAFDDVGDEVTLPRLRPRPAPW
jgi:hypothetical protein